MKKTIFLVAMIFLCSLSYAQIKINPSGNVGIGTSSPGSKLHVVGNTTITGITTLNGHVKLAPNIGSNGYFYLDNTGYSGSVALYPNWNNSGYIGKSNQAFMYIYGYHLINLSDGRQKENIQDINNALDIVLKLKGLRYDLKREYVIKDSITDEKLIAKLDKERKNQVGFIAQDVISVLPSAVSYDDSTDIYGIEYNKIVPVLVEAIKEQQAMIEDLKAKIDKKGKMKSADVTGEEENSNMEIDEPYLEQNAPNPFSEATTINFYLPDEVSKSLLNIYDMQGLQIKSYCITERGNSSVIINASELLSGMYLYTLIVDNKEIDTKRMILTD